MNTNMKRSTLVVAICLLVGLINNAKAQKVKQDSITFFRDTLVIYYGSNTWWAIKDSTVNSDTLKINHTFDKNVTVKSVSIYFRWIDGAVSISYDMVIINGKKYNMETDVIDRNVIFTIDTPIPSNNLKIFIAGFPRIGIGMRLKNIVANYEYNDNTSINEVINDNDIKLIDGRFITSLNIQNIKLYDITGKLIQEGTLNDKYDLQSNKLYFVLFDNKYTKKYAINN